MRSLSMIAAVVGLSGMRPIIDGSNQSLSVKTIAGTADVAGSQCSLTNNKGTWFVTTQEL